LVGGGYGCVHDEGCREDGCEHEEKLLEGVGFRVAVLWRSSGFRLVAVRGIEVWGESALLGRWA